MTLSQNQNLFIYQVQKVQGFCFSENGGVKYTIKHVSRKKVQKEQKNVNKNCKNKGVNKGDSGLCRVPMVWHVSQKDYIVDKFVQHNAVINTVIRYRGVG